MISSDQTLAEVENLLQQINRIILGKEHTVKLALTCLLAKGHLLIEDLPGVGKTTLAHTLANLLGLSFQRIQFTSDLLPADILGVSIYDRETEGFRFHPGPIFTQLVLGDEINRATPKTQSALLEAMEEHQVTIEGKTHPLPKPFFVIATQNPTHQIGTFSLPESQLDRFLMRINIGYPDAQHEKQLLMEKGGRALLDVQKQSVSPDTLLNWQQQIQQIHVSDTILDYILALIEASRSYSAISHGLSPRAGQALLQAAKAWAWLDQKKQIQPEHVQAVWHSVADHRLTASGGDNSNPASQIIQAVPVP